MRRKSSLFISAQLICLLGQFSSAATGQRVDLSASDTHRQSRFISFDSKSGQIDINLDLSVPFLSIPLEEKTEKNGPPMPLLNVNTKALAVFGVIMALSAFVVPLLVQKIPEQPPAQPPEMYHHYSKEHKRSDRGLDLSYFSDSLNEILFRDSRVTPCVQRVVCSAVTAASHSDNPTSVDKIIDGLSSLKWFEEAANGTGIKEAVSKGRETVDVEECSKTYKDCILNQKIIANVMKMIGI